MRSSYISRTVKMFSKSSQMIIFNERNENLNKLPKAKKLMNENLA